MDIKHVFKNLSATWVRWSDYEIKEGSGVAYIVPTQASVRIEYSSADKPEEMLTAALLVGQKAFDTATDLESICLEFTRQYGLFGDTKQSEQSNIFAGSDALSPIYKKLNSKAYGEPYNGFCHAFATMYRHFLLYQGVDHPELKAALWQKSDDNAAIPCGMSYHLTEGEHPTLVWQPDNLLAMIKLTYALAVTDNTAPLKMCKNCGKAYYNPHAKSEFCSVKCRNYYNVKAFREREKVE